MLPKVFIGPSVQNVAALWHDLKVVLNGSGTPHSTETVFVKLSFKSSDAISFFTLHNC